MGGDLESGQSHGDLPQRCIFSWHSVCQSLQPRRTPLLPGRLRKTHATAPTILWKCHHRNSHAGVSLVCRQDRRPWWYRQHDNVLRFEIGICLYCRLNEPSFGPTRSGLGRSNKATESKKELQVLIVENLKHFFQNYQIYKKAMFKKRM